jgi:hypothetical protein
MEILKLTHPFITPRNVVLPHRDAFGVAHGEGFSPILDAEDMKASTRTTFGSVKCQRMHEALTMSQLRALLAFNFNPYVVDIRDHYPFYEQGAYNRARLKGQRMQTSDVRPCNILLTLVLPPDHRIHHHGISIMDGLDRLDSRAPPLIDRANKDILARGWTWEALYGDQFSRRAYGNHILMRSWIANVDVRKHYCEANAFAARLVRKSMKGTFDNVIDRNSRHLAISSDWAYQLFAIAVSFGFLYVDQTKDLRVDQPLYMETG